MFNQFLYQEYLLVFQFWDELLKPSNYILYFNTVNVCFLPK